MRVRSNRARDGPQLATHRCRDDHHHRPRNVRGPNANGEVDRILRSVSCGGSRHAVAITVVPLAAAPFVVGQRTPRRDRKWVRSHGKLSPSGAFLAVLLGTVPGRAQNGGSDLGVIVRNTTKRLRRLPGASTRIDAPRNPVDPHRWGRESRTVSPVAFPSPQTAGIVAGAPESRPDKPAIPPRAFACASDPLRPVSGRLQLDRTPPFTTRAPSILWLILILRVRSTRSRATQRSSGRLRGRDDHRHRPPNVRGPNTEELDVALAARSPAAAISAGSPAAKTGAGSIARVV